LHFKPIMKLRPFAQSPSATRLTHFLRTSTSLVLLASFLCSGCNRDPKKFVAQGNQSFDQGKYPDALIYYGRALQLDPRLAEAHFKIAQTHLKMKSWNAAFGELRRTVELQPDNWAAQLELGRLELAGGKQKDSKDRAQLILKSQPNNVDSQLLLADADAALGNTKEAIEDANAAIAMAPERASSYLNLAQILIRAGNLKDAETNLLKAQSLDSKSTLSYMVLGALYFQQKRFADSEKQFQTAVSVTPDDPAPRAALSNLYSAQGQTAQAEQVLTDAKNQLSSNPAAYRMLGDSYIGRGQMDKSLTEFASLSAKYPNDLSVQKTYVQLLILNNRLDEAMALGDAILKKNPQDSEALILKGQIQLRQRKVDDAFTTLQSAVKIAPDNALGHFHLGLALAERGSAEQAEKEWREAVRLRSGLPEAWLALSKSSLQKSDWKNLEETSNQLKKYSPNAADGYLYHATARMNQGDPLGAEADLMNLQRIAPHSPMYSVKMGELRLAQRRLGDAEAMFRQALSRDPDSLEAVRGLVQIDQLTNKRAEALSFVQQQIKRNPNSPVLLQMQGELQMQAKQLQEAEVSLNRVLELDKNSVSAMVLLAQLQIANSQFDKAVVLYKRAIEVSPRDVRLQISLGETYERSGDWQQAQSTYQKALVVAPENPVASNNLAFLLLEHGGSPSVALTLAQTARKGLPNLSNTADTLGWAYYTNGGYSVAAPLFEEAIKAAPNNQTYRYHLGLTYQKLNDPARAKTELERVISLNPTSPLADQARRVLSELTNG
jgi:tetratricopeptide (TPR) repeat protein